LVSCVDLKIRENNEASLKILATKEDVAKLEGKPEKLIAETRADMIKLKFIFWNRFYTYYTRRNVCFS
jgi:hypothetical protein